MVYRGIRPDCQSLQTTRGYRDDDPETLLLLKLGFNDWMIGKALACMRLRLEDND